jgi:hypothetical protein
MTAQARITQADMDRAGKLAARFERARIILDLENRKIEIIIGESSPPPSVEEWSDDDV